MNRRGLFIAAAALAVAPGALAADDDDLAWVRVLIAAEVLALAYYDRLLRVALTAGQKAQIRRLVTHAQQHYSVLAPVVGPTAAVPADFDIAFPRGSFSAGDRALRLGKELHAALLGAYLGAASNVKDAALRPTLVGLAASTAQHLSAVAALADGVAPAGNSLPRPLTIDEASSALDPYLG